MENNDVKSYFDLSQFTTIIPGIHGFNNIATIYRRSKGSAKMNVPRCMDDFVSENQKVTISLSRNCKVIAIFVDDKTDVLGHHVQLRPNRQSEISCCGALKPLVDKGIEFPAKYSMEFYVEQNAWIGRLIEIK
jgi:hypothetical protein